MRLVVYHPEAVNKLKSCPEERLVIGSDQYHEETLESVGEDDGDGKRTNKMTFSPRSP